MEGIISPPPLVGIGLNNGSVKKTWKRVSNVHLVLQHQGRNRSENLDATSVMVGRICLPGGDRVKVSENLGATAVAPVAPVVTSLVCTVEANRGLTRGS